jgi:hypothetical protein
VQLLSLSFLEKEHPNQCWIQNGGLSKLLVIEARYVLAGKTKSAIDRENLDGLVVGVATSWEVGDGWGGDEKDANKPT